MDNIAPYELIPWLLGQCTSLDQVKVLLRRLNLIRLPFSERLPLTPLHWMISDRDGSMTLESVQEGLRVYDNPVGVLTNNPPFDFPDAPPHKLPQPHPGIPHEPLFT